MSDDNTKTPVEVGQVWDTISDGRIRVIKGNGLGQWEVELVNAPGKGGVMTERHFTRLIKLPPLTPAEIAELRLLEAAATKGPWESNEEKRGMSTVFRYIRESTPFNKFGGKNCVVGYTSYLSSRDGEVGGPSITAVDANLIAALRNAAPRLLAAAEREGQQSARIATLEKLVREAMPYVEHKMKDVASYHVLVQTPVGDYHGHRWLSAAREAVGEGAK